MKITIAGYGYVGQAYGELLQGAHQINIVDPKVNNNKIGSEDAVLVCVATPQSDDGSCDVSNVLAVISQTHRNTPVLIKSTISLEGWEEIVQQFPDHSITFSPEFLRAKSAIDDVLNNASAYFGSGNVDFWCRLFEAAYQKRGQFFSCTICDPKALILAKYFRNSFLATKVSFFNQVYDLCKATGIEYDQVRSVVTNDPRIGSSHTEITEERGFGGHCFPKDTSAIVETAESKNVFLSVIRAAIDYNNKVRG